LRNARLEAFMRDAVMAGWLFGALCSSLSGCDTDDDSEVQAAPAASSEQAIVNGTAITSAVHPTTFALVVHAEGAGGGSFCSATLIAPDVLMTAAHCAVGFQQNVNGGFRNYGVNAANVGQLSDLPEDAVEIIDWVIHPDYREDNSNPTPDVALAFLQDPINNPAPALLLQNDDERSHVRDGATMIAVGFGLDQAGGNGGGQKREATTTMQYVTDQLIFFGVPLENVVTVNKCNGDSGGPSYLRVGDQLRVVGIASRSDCRTGTIDIRADAYAAYFDSEMRAACTRGTRTSCASPGLPAAAEGALLPAATPDASLRAMSSEVHAAFAAAGEQLAPCFGIEADEIEVVEATRFLGVAGGTCTPDDVDTVVALGNCLAGANCNAYADQQACLPQYDAALTAAYTCGDQLPPEPVNIDGLEEPLLSALQQACDRISTCFNVPVDACIAEYGPQLLDIQNFDCERFTMVYAQDLACMGGLACGELQADNPGGCFSSDVEYADAQSRCDDLSGLEPGAGEGEGEGEGQAGEGEGEDDEEDDDDDDDRDDDPRLEPEPQPSLFNCSHAPGGMWWAALGLLFRRRRT
jgi:hypothetical protein